MNEEENEKGRMKDGRHVEIKVREEESLRSSGKLYEHQDIHHYIGKDY